jgi:hypothetical protein
VTASGETNTDFSDSVNIQPERQNPHDVEFNQQEDRTGQAALPKSIDAYVAEYRSGPESTNEHVDTINIQPESQNPHDTGKMSCGYKTNEQLNSEIKMLVNDDRTVAHILDNDETARHLRSACELLEECETYLMLEIGSMIDLVAASDGESFQFGEAYDPDAGTDYNPVVELIEDTAPKHIQRSLLDYEAIPDDQLNPEDHIDIEDTDSFQALMEAPGIFYVAPGMQKKYDI